MSDRPLWTIDAMARPAMRARAAGALPRIVPASRSTAAPSRRAKPSSPSRAKPRRPRLRRRRAASRRRRSRVVAADSAADVAADAPLLVVADVLEALRDLARAARARSAAQDRRASPARSARPAPRRRCAWRCRARATTHASAASYNNHWGVPLSLARCRQTRASRVFEIGMNHAGEITPLTRLVRPHVAIITTVEPVHLEYLRLGRGDRRCQGGDLLGLEPGGAAVLNRDNPQFDAACARRAQSAGVDAHRLASASTPRPTRGCSSASLQPDCSTVQAAHSRRRGRPTSSARRAAIMVLNSLAVLAAVALARRRSCARRAGARRAAAGRPAAARA